MRENFFEYEEKKEINSPIDSKNDITKLKSPRFRKMTPPCIITNNTTF